MTAALLILARIGGFFRSLPWQVYAAAAAALALWIAVGQYHAEIAKATQTGAAAQASVDRAGYVAAETAATAKQAKIIADLATKQSTISKGTADALANADLDIDRRAAALRMRHDADGARQGATGGSAAAALPDAASSDHEAACTVSGGLSFSAALDALTDAEHDAATLRAAQQWMREQAAAWPTNPPTDAPPVALPAQ